MERIKLLDKELNVIYSDLHQECDECFISCSMESELVEKCRLNSKKCRRGVKKSETGLAFYCSENNDEIRSSKCFKKKIELYGGVVNSVGRMSDVIRKQINANTGILLHNLVSLNAHNIQEVHAVIPQDNVGLNFKDKIAIAEKTILENPTEFAKAMYRVSKNNMAMKIEFSVFNRLLDISQQLSYRKHDIKKVFLSILHNFFQDFSEKKVFVNVVGDSFDVFIDYESMHVVFHHILENTTKYCLRGNNIEIVIVPENKKLCMNMHSLEITDKDMKYIYEEGYSGDYAQLAEKSGKGIGMSRVKKLLELNNASIDIVRNIDPPSQVIKRGVSYVKNSIVIAF